MLFDDRKQLEPNSVGLENTGEKFRREIPGLGFSAQDRGDLWMLAVHHIRQQFEQYVRGFLAVERGLMLPGALPVSTPCRPALYPVMSFPRGNRTPGFWFYGT